MKNSQNLQRLLAVAQTIIQQCADRPTQAKYLHIKQQLCSLENNYRPSQSSQNFHSSVVNLSSDKSTPKIMRSMGNTVNMKNPSSNKKKQLTRQSSKKSCKKQSRQRIDTFDSRTKPIRTYHQEQKDNLDKIAFILKNAYSCPEILRNCTLLTQNQISYNPTLLDIQDSLRRLYQTVSETKPESKVKQSSVMSMDEVGKDNIWLLSKLEAMVNQNTILRRMVGRS